jgi:DNA repair exonuclease SbcCD ATPase subunit
MKLRIGEHLTRAQSSKTKLEAAIASLSTQNAELEQKLSLQQSRVQQRELDRVRSENEALTQEFNAARTELRQQTAAHEKGRNEHGTLLRDNAELKRQHGELVCELQSAVKAQVPFAVDLEALKASTVRNVGACTGEMAELIQHLMRELGKSYEEYEALAKAYGNPKPRERAFA